MCSAKLSGAFTVQMKERRPTERRRRCWIQGEGEFQLVGNIPHSASWTPCRKAESGPSHSLLCRAEGHCWEQMIYLWEKWEAQIIWRVWLGSLEKQGNPGGVRIGSLTIMVRSVELCGWSTQTTWEGGNASVKIFLVAIAITVHSKVNCWGPTLFRTLC